MQLVRTNSENRHFIDLVNQLDTDLAERDGEDHSFYSQFNKDNIKYALVAYIDQKPIGCGAIKEFKSDSMQVKRMYVLPRFRGQGIAKTILLDLENWTKELGYTKCVLETGKRQPEAIQLYKSKGYKIISNYGQYIGIENSICFQKYLK